MSETARLRFSILVALASTSTIATAACGSQVSDAQSSGTSAGSGGGGTGGTTTSGSTTSVAGTGGGTTSASSGTTGPGGGGTGGSAPTCPDGPPVQQCFTLDQLEDIINNPPQGGDPDPPPPPDAGTPDAGDGGVMLTDCVETSLVYDGCCNNPVAGPKKQGELCCYVFCEGACCGRPFVVDGHAKVASAIERGDWSAEMPGASAATLDTTTRAALAEAWLSDARMEHASIASFARFTLELLAVGAPPELVSASQHASLDEIEHARLCFAIAARYAGKPVGPGALDTAGGGRTGSLAESAAAAVREGCIGETIAAVMAREQLALTGDTFVRSALARIADDEGRHAELAWRFVGWALATGGADVRAAVHQAFDEGMRDARPPRLAQGVTVDAYAWAHAGRLDDAGSSRAVREALDDVIAPCRRTLLT